MTTAIPVIATTLSLVLGLVIAQTDGELRYPERNVAHGIEHFAKVPPDVKRVLARSCGDCHSNDTRWSWYSYIPFAGSKLQDDVRKARNRLNLSDWPALIREGPDEVVGRVIAVCEETDMGNMPPQRYLKMHPEAALSQQDRKRLCSWSQDMERELRRNKDTASKL